MNFPKAVIFDMDGLMFDTENITSKAWKEVARKENFYINDEIIQNFVGLTNKDIIKKMQVFYDLDDPIVYWRKQVLVSKKKLLQERTSYETFLKKGLLSLLEYLHKKGIKLAVASSSDKKDIDYLLKRTSISSFFLTVVSGEEVLYGKPHPEIFLKASEKLDVDAVDSWVLEDSPSGIEAAVSSGMTSCLIPDLAFVSKETRDLADYVFDDLSKLQEYLTDLEKRN